MLGRFYKAVLGFGLAIPSIILYKAVTIEDKMPLHTAAAKGDFEAISALEASGFDVNILDDMGRTPMDIAASMGHVSTIRALAKVGADVNSVDSFRTPVEIAAINGQVEAVQTLLELGANLDMHHINSAPPLYKAVCRGDFYAANILLKAGANPSIGEMDDTPLECAKRSRTQQALMIFNLWEKTHQSGTILTETTDDQHHSALTI